MMYQPREIVLVVAAVAFSAAVVPLFGHHSPSAEFDSSKAVTIQGAITKLDWTNPHVWVYMSVKEKDGKVYSWGAELDSPGALMKSKAKSFDKSYLRVGDIIKVEGWLAKNGSKRVGAQTLTLPDGRVFDVADDFSKRGILLRGK